SLMDPPPEELGGPAIFLIRAGIARLVAVQLETNHVAGMLVVKPLLKFAVDHVIRRTSDVREVADLGDVVPPSAKRMNLGHGSRSSECLHCVSVWRSTDSGCNRRQDAALQ